MHLFAFEVEPATAEIMGGEIARAKAFVFVRESNPAKAEAAARELVLSKGWLIGAMELTEVLTPKQIAGLDAKMSAAYQSALREGRHALFAAFPNH